MQYLTKQKVQVCLNKDLDLFSEFSLNLSLACSIQVCGALGHSTKGKSIPFCCHLKKNAFQGIK
jgi:hypothetical protein